MNIYLICNNLLSSNIDFDNNMNIEEKKKLRPLSIEGSSLANKLDIKNISKIYSSYYFSNIESAKYLAEKNMCNIYLHNDLKDCVIGELNNQSLKMLSYFQEHDFNYKLVGGESLMDCANRINMLVNSLKKEKEDIAIFLPRRALFSYLSKYAECGFNLEERLVLSVGEEILMESNEEDIDVFKINFIEEEIKILKVNVEA